MAWTQAPVITADAAPSSIRMSFVRDNATGVYRFQCAIPHSSSWSSALRSTEGSSSDALTAQEVTDLGTILDALKAAATRFTALATDTVRDWFWVQSGSLYCGCELSRVDANGVTATLRSDGRRASQLITAGQVTTLTAILTKLRDYSLTAQGFVST